MTSYAPRNKKNIEKASSQEESDVILSLRTSTPEPLIVKRSDLICSAAKDLIAGGNVLFTGKSGAGKSVRKDALLQPENYKTIFAGTDLENIEVEITAIDVDLIPVLASGEVQYISTIENGSSFRKPVAIAEMLLKYGYKSEAEMLDAEKERKNVLKKKNGRIELKIIAVDDFDRTADVSITNAFMKFINDYKHNLYSGEVRHLNLQSIATSNSTCAGPQRGYHATKGIDVAIGNRFCTYSVERSNLHEILSQQFPQEFHGYIQKLCAMAEEIMLETDEGSFSAIGEISLRQIRKCVEMVVYGIDTPKAAATRLLAGVPRDDNERVKADALIAKYFDPASMRRASNALLNI